jgi:rSAM/selenodomain-associated transferase 1
VSRTRLSYRGSMASLAFVILAKHPTPGRVKTRLQPEFTADQSAAIQDLFLRHCVGRLNNLSVGQVFVFFDPPTAAAEIGDLLRVAQVELQAQCGGDLGCRISHAADSIGGRFENILIFGVDSPDVPVAFIRDLTDQLDTHDAVLAPTDDGGFWSIGLRSGIDVSDALSGIEWSSGHEMVQVMQKLQACGLTVGIGQTWTDVDRPPDVTALLDRLYRSSNADDRALLEAMQAVVSPIVIREGFLP